METTGPFRCVKTHIYIFLYRIQAGQYDEAYAYLEKAIELETEKLGNRPHRLAEFHDIAALIFEQVRHKSQIRPQLVGASVNLAAA